GHEDEIGRPGTDHLVGDVDGTALRVPGFRLHHAALVSGCSRVRTTLPLGAQHEARPALGAQRGASSAASVMTSLRVPMPPSALGGAAFEAALSSAGPW